MESDMREWNYRHYVASSLRALGGWEDDLRDWLKPRRNDTRTPDEIVNDTIIGAGLHWSE